MAEKIISVKINVDDKSLEQLEGDLQGIGMELQSLEQTASKFSLEDKLAAADGAIKTMAGSLQAVVGTLGLLGIESEKFGDFEKKAASAIALGMGLKDMSEGVGKLALAWDKAGLSAKLFGTTAKTALVATGIGAFVVLLGTVVAYWDEIISAVDGVSVAQKDLLETQEASTAEQQRQLDAVSQQENILKLQGKTEREILELKMKETNEVITALEAQVETQKKVKDAQVAAAARNQMILQGFVRFLTIPITILLGAVDALTLGLEKIGVLSEGGATNLEESFSGGIAKFIFDPDEVNKKGDETIQATEDQITKLKNQRAGFQLAVNKIDNDAAQKVKDQQDKTKAESDKAEDDRLKSLEAIRKDYVKRAEDDAAQTELEKVQLEEQRALDELTRLEANLEQKKQIEDYYRQLKRIAEEEDDQKAKEKSQKDQQDAYNLAMENIQMEYDMAQEKIYVRSMIVDAVSQLAGEETAIGKAAFIAQQALRIDDLVATAKAALQKIAIDQAGTGADIGKGFAATLKAGFPANVPYLIAYAAQAAAIVASTVSAFSKAKSTVSKVGGVSGGSMSAPSIQAPGTPGGANNNLAINAPQFQPEERAIRTYVLSGDVTSSQEADAKLNRRRSLG